jgi:hypothetical protein
VTLILITLLDFFALFLLRHFTSFFL